MISKEDLGTYFIKDGEIYHCNVYTDKPTVNFKNIRTGENKTVVCDSPVADEFNKLYEVPTKYGLYNIDEAMPVEWVVDKEGE